ncbi:MAG TPA: hypothetical protein VKF61_04675 [Candidatus Polarisedimenticolia bacterium]|nr:hypothetical protein [Candidatus Polarisedimenticolia bacterium]
MDRKAVTPITVLAVVCLGAALSAVFLWIDRAKLVRTNGDLDSRVQELQKELESVKAAEQAMRAEMSQRVEQATQRTEQVAQQAQQAARLRQEVEAIRNPPEDRPTCIDSDAKYGADAIYIRGSVRAGNVQVSDHCRLGQLVEFSCIENPVRSGRFLVDSRIMNCPAGSRCVDGECLR